MARRDGEPVGVGRDVGHHGVAVGDLTREDRAGEFVADGGLHEAPQWASAVGRVEPTER